MQEENYKKYRIITKKLQEIQECYRYKKNTRLYKKNTRKKIQEENKEQYKKKIKKIQ